MLKNLFRFAKTMNEEKKKILKSLFIPLLMLFLFWWIKLIEVILEVNFGNYGLYPRTLLGLRGIIFSPFIHADFSHLISNSVPVLILLTAIFYFYRTIAYKVFVLSLIITGIIAWVIARESHHIGASGLVYAYASFIFVSGIIRRNIQLTALALFVVFLYGGIIWGIFPKLQDWYISWESHLAGLITGCGLAFYYKDKGPQPIQHEWENEDSDDDTININDTSLKDLN